MMTYNPAMVQQLKDTRMADLRRSQPSPRRAELRHDAALRPAARPLLPRRSHQ